jgi:hypothetical protein
MPRDHRRPLAPRGQREEQLGVVDKHQVGAGRVLGERRTGGDYRPGTASARGPRNGRELERRPGPFGPKILQADRGDVPDLVPGVEQGADLPVVDTGVGGMMNDRAHHHPHRGSQGLDARRVRHHAAGVEQEPGGGGDRSQVVLPVSLQHDDQVGGCHRGLQVGGAGDVLPVDLQAGTYGPWQATAAPRVRSLRAIGRASVNRKPRSHQQLWKL